MRIDELFDQPQPIQWERKGQGPISAKFTVDDVTFKMVFFKGVDGFGNIEWTVTFGLIGRSHYYNARKDPGSTSRDFKHKAVLVFSTVLNAIDEFFKQEKPKVLYLAASSDRQDKMYDRLVKSKFPKAERGI